MTRQTPKPYTPPEPIEKAYAAWLHADLVDPELKREAMALTDITRAEDAAEGYRKSPTGVREEVRDRFGSLLDFGTAGLRGKLGAGYNRMNNWTVGTTIQALADTLKDLYEAAELKEKVVVIGYDTRYGSRDFALLASQVLAANGIRSQIPTDYCPTPLLAYATRILNTAAGIMVTASHNPREYNGVKFYEPSGIQMGEAMAARIASHRRDTYALTDQGEARGEGYITDWPSDLENRYRSDILSRYATVQAPEALSIVFTPMHGTGGSRILSMLEDLGFRNVHPVLQQLEPDPDFPTAHYPNPESADAMAPAARLAEKVGADIVLAVDPDADRLAVMLPDGHGGYRQLTGNETGGLLTDYYIRDLRDRHELPPHATLVKTVVTDSFGADIARREGVHVEESLTGFKNICGKIKDFEHHDERHYIMGYEESIGYALGTRVLDKDGISALIFLAYCAANEKYRGRTLGQRLIELQEALGYYASLPESRVIAGERGEALKGAIMEHFRRMTPDDWFDVVTEDAGTKETGADDRRTEEAADMASPAAPAAGAGELIRKDDYLRGIGLSFRREAGTILAESDTLDTPRSDVLRFFFGDGAWFAVRPSGTEPKLKFYFYGHHADEATAKAQAERLRRLANGIVAEVEAASEREP